METKAVQIREIMDKDFIAKPHFNDLFFFTIELSICAPLIYLWKLLVDILLQ